ncbi:hypothetical protein LCGC14_2109820, partial [marine sediment metagenome]
AKVTTSPASRRPTPEPPGPGIPPTPAAQTRPTIDPAAAAQRRFRLAQAYLNAGLAKKARDVLREILRDYPDTPAAGKAREALNPKP